MGIAAVIFAAFLLASCDDTKEKTDTPAGKSTTPPAGSTATAPPPALPPAQKLPKVKRSDVSKAITTPDSGGPIMPDELMVLLRDNATEAAFTQALGDLPVKIVGRMPLFRMLQVEVPAERREELRISLEALAPVRAVTYQSVGKSFAGPDDRVFTNDDPTDDWNLRAIHALEAWKITPGHPNVLIAVLDGGSLISHEELAGKVIRPASGLAEDGVTQVRHEVDHGTHVAVTAAGLAGNGRGTAGVCPACSVIPVQVNFTLAQTAAGLEYVIRNGARVINMSHRRYFKDRDLKGFASRGGRAAAEGGMLDVARTGRHFSDVIMRVAEANGVVIVKAAGNQNLPAAFSRTCRHRYSLCVGAAGIGWKGPSKGRLVSANFSNYGHYVDVSAPGLSIFSAISGPGTGAYKVLQGTSMAAPHVAGLAGLLIAAKPFLNFPPVYLRKPALLLAGKYIVLVQDALKGAKRASMICLARPLDIKPGSRLTLEVHENYDAKGPRLSLAGHETRLVF